MSDGLLEQRNKFYAKLGRNASDIWAVVSEMYGGEAVKKSSVSVWHILFKDGRENVEDNERSGRPRSQRTDENVEIVRCLVHSDKRLSIRAMAMQLNLNKETVTCVEKARTLAQQLDSLL
jgi:hypothetical protein